MKKTVTYKIRQGGSVTVQPAEAEKNPPEAAEKKPEAKPETKQKVNKNAGES